MSSLQKAAKYPVPDSKQNEERAAGSKESNWKKHIPSVK